METIEIVSGSISGTRPGLRTKDGYFNAPGAERKPGCKHDLVEKLFPQVFPQGDRMPLPVFQSRYRGLLRAVGFQSNYAKKLSMLSSLDKSWIHAGHIKVS